MPDSMLIDGNSLLPKSDRIILRVDEKLFYTTKDTLAQESGYFSSLFSGRWPNSSENGVLTLDVDGDVFKHTMCFLRSGVLPVFYDASKGFDHRLYSLLLEQADFFRIDRLSDWILEKRYVQAVKIVRSIKQSEKTRWVESDNTERRPHEFRDREDTADTKVEHFVYSTKRKFRSCKEEYCSQWDDCECYCTEICKNLPQDGHDYLERDVMNLVEIRTKTVFDHQICRDRGHKCDVPSHPQNTSRAQ